MKHLIPFFLSIFILSACGGGTDGNGNNVGGNIDLDTFAANEANNRGFVPLAPQSNAQLADYNFAQPAQYVERRLFMLQQSPADLSQFEVIQELDADIKAGLSETDLFNLNEAVTDSGYAFGCLPASCAFYLVALVDSVAIVVDNQQDLLGFLGEIDHPAEIHFVVDVWSYVQYYQEVSDGFRAIAQWIDCDGNEAVQLLVIDRFGNVTLEQELVRQTTNIVC